MNVSAHDAAVELLARRRARTSLIEFTTYTNPQYVSADHHRLIAAALERVLTGDCKRLMICMPPRHGKSELASRRFPAYALAKNPTKQIIAASYNSDIAADFGRNVRNIVDDPGYRNLYPNVTLASDSRAADRWHTNAGGMYVAAGVGTAITGRGADILLIDDPFKDREEADSEIRRMRVWDWYTSTAYTRLMPGGAIVVINCMTGDTPVLMMDGSESALSDIRPGDEVATWDKGRLGTSKIINHINNGSDKVYKITMKSGKIVRANERHPFLVYEQGKYKWVRLKCLKLAQKIVTLRVNGESGKTGRAAQMDAISRSYAKDFAHPTTTKPSGQAGIDRHQSTKNRNLLHILGTDTASESKSIGGCLLSKEGSAQFATSNKPQAGTGETSYALITVTTQGKCAGYSAITVTSPLETEKQKQSSCAPPNTSDFDLDEVATIIFDGIEDVFDIQVEGTENFIANGLVSHNTRWHDDDLSGRLLAEQENGGDQWEVLSLPAIDTQGRALWHEWYPIERLNEIRAVLPARDWNSLYQQNPIPDDGDYFKSDWMRHYDELPDGLAMYAASDYAVTADGGDYTEHGVFGVDSQGNVYVVDWWSGQTTSDVWIEQQCNLIDKHKPIIWFGESGVIRRSVEPWMIKRMNERRSHCRMEWMASISDKPTRARSIQALASMGKLFLPKNALFAGRLLSQLLRFPAGKHDDAVDVFSLIGRGMPMIKNFTPKKPKSKNASQFAGMAGGWMG